MSDITKGAMRQDSPGQASDTRAAGWAQGLTLAAQGALPTMGAVAFVPVLPLMMAEFAAMPNSNYWVPALLGAPGVCIALLSPLAGFIGDRFGRKAPLTIALALYALAGVAPLALHSYVSMLGSRIILGVCEALVMTLSAAMLGDYFTGHARNRWLATVHLLAGLSGILFIISAGLIGSEFGWRAVSIIYALSLIFVPLMLIFTWEPLTLKFQETARRERAAPFPWVHAVATAIASLIGGILLYSIIFHQAIALSELGVTDPAKIGALGAVGALAPTVGTAAFWPLMKLRLSYLFPLELIIVGIGMTGMAHASNEYVFVIFVAIAMFGNGLLLPTLLTWTVSGFVLEARARGASIFQSFLALGQFACSVIIASLAHTVAGTTQAAFGYVGAGALMCAVVGFVLMRRTLNVEVGTAPAV
jgi:MFS family permease